MKKVLSVLLALLLFLSFMPSSDGVGFLPGDIVILGSYEQDNNPANGREPIEWIVLDAQSEKALLVSAAVLDTQAYHNSLEDISWEDCTIRSWLNYYFLNTAFTTAEQKQILTATVPSDKNPRNSTLMLTGSVLLQLTSRRRPTMMIIWKRKPIPGGYDHQVMHSFLQTGSIMREK